jgi:GTP-binding protein LepA
VPQLNGAPVDALTTIVHKSNVEHVGRAVALRLKDVLSRQQFDVAIQACVGSKVVARETVKAVRKNVLVKSGKLVGGGDISRKKKLLEKQKEGKKRMKRVGNVELSQEAFLSVIGGGAGK